MFATTEAAPPGRRGARAPAPDEQKTSNDDEDAGHERRAGIGPKLKHFLPPTEWLALFSVAFALPFLIVSAKHTPTDMIGDVFLGAPILCCTACRSPDEPSNDRSTA
jgi:hypothetical protein